jgi:hypothetical protein
MEINATLTDNKTYVRDYYKSTYNVWWDNRKEITYSHRLANIIGCDVVNEAASGGGTERVLRMAYQFVQDNFKIKDDIFLILELPSLGRLDMFSKTLNDYIITNIIYTTNDYRDDNISYYNACRDYSVTGDLEKIGAKNVKMYLDNFHTRKSEYTKIARQINTFLTYLKYHNIKFIFTNGEFNASIHSDLKKHNLINIKLGNMVITDFHQFSVDTKSTIAEDTNLLSMDLHPGYFAHLKFAELLDGYIKEKYDTF